MTILLVGRNPQPSRAAKRSFTHSIEQIIWARKREKVPHVCNYELMKEINGNGQMKDVWTLPAIRKWEKSCGKHPPQKPLEDDVNKSRAKENQSLKNSDLKFTFLKFPEKPS